MNRGTISDRQEEWTRDILPHVDQHFGVQARIRKRATKDDIIHVIGPSGTLLSEFDIIEDPVSTRRHGRVTRR
jgi:hypothetical protein